MKDQTDLKIRETAVALGLHETTARAWVERGAVRAYRLPKAGDRRPDSDEIERIRAAMILDGGSFEPSKQPEVAVVELEGRAIGARLPVTG